MKSQNHTYSFKAIADYMIQILNGLQCIHGNSISHLNIKPSKILIFTNNEDKILKINVDGCVKKINHEFETDVRGTVPYMSPEMIDSKPYSIATDIWSLGCLMLDMLTMCCAQDGEYDS